MGRFQWSLDHSWTKLLSRHSLTSRRRRQTVFGRDLITLLTETGRQVPLVLQCCTEFVEHYGLIDGIYRLSGVSSNIHKLRLAFDSDKVPDLSIINGDVHAVASLLKLFFRLLPDPLLTFALHDAFLESISHSDNKLERINHVVSLLPIQHRRTLSFLIKHLSKVSKCSSKTAMNAKNLSIVWAPNLLRSKELESGSGGVAALHIIGTQAILIEFLITHCDEIFNEEQEEEYFNCNNMISIETEPIKKRKHKGWKFWSSPTRLRIGDSNNDLTNKRKFIEQLNFGKLEVETNIFYDISYEFCTDNAIEELPMWEMCSDNRSYSVNSTIVNDYYLVNVNPMVDVICDNSRARIEAYKERRRAVLREAYLAKENAGKTTTNTCDMSDMTGMTISIAPSKTIPIAASKTTSIAASKTTSIPVSKTISIAASKTTSIAASKTIPIAAPRKTVNNKNNEVKRNHKYMNMQMRPLQKPVPRNNHVHKLATHFDES